MIKECLNCKGPRKPYSTKYCSLKCQHAYQSAEVMRKWLAGEIPGGNIWGISETIRNYLFIKFDSKCVKCKWGEMNPTTGRVPLEVNHIDGNWDNNKEENLELVCPNCHSLTSNFRSLNNGSGRHKKIVAMGFAAFTKPAT